ncbi:MAG TPA: sigma-70 family RNA polymerase sigma factor [Mycobacteriales bacterium]
MTAATEQQPATADLAAALAGARARDERAFVVLWRAFTPPLRRYLTVLAPGWADDLVSETWHDVIRDLGRFSGDEQGFRAWLFTVARHRALDWHRREAVRPADPVPVDHLADRRAPDDTVADALEALATERALSLVRRLPPDQAEVVSLRVLAGLHVAQVAAITGRRPGTVRVLAHRGLHRLADLLGGSPPG